MGNNADYIIKSADTDKTSLLKDETIFVQANGSLGSKNHFVEGYGTNDVAVTLMNGFYNTYPFKYEENYSQFPQEGQTIVNLPSVSDVRFKFNGHNVNLTEMGLIDVSRTFDLTSGLVKRVAKYKTGLLTVKITEEKLVSYDKDLIAYRLSFGANQKGKLEINSKLSMPNVVSNETYDPRVGAPKKHLDLKSIQISADDACMVVETTNTNMALAVCMTHDINLNYHSNENGIDSTISIDYEYGDFVFHKYGLYQRLANTTDVFDKGINEIFETLLEKEKNKIKDILDNL